MTGDKQLGGSIDFRGICPNQTDTLAGKNLGSGQWPTPTPTSQLIPTHHTPTQWSHPRKVPGDHSIFPHLPLQLPRPQIADTSAVCLVPIMMLKIHLFSLLGVKSCSSKSDFQNKTKPYSRFEGQQEALKWSAAKPCTHHIVLENRPAYLNVRKSGTQNT